MKPLPIIMAGTALAAVLVITSMTLRGNDEPDVPAIAETNAVEPTQSAAVPEQSSMSAEDEPPPPPPSDDNIEFFEDAAELDSETVSRLFNIEDRRGQTISPQAWEAARAAPSWEARDEPAPHLPLEAGERDDGRAFIDFNRLKLDGLQAGERMELNIPQQARNYTFVVQDVEEHGGGIASWNGHLDGLPTTYSTTITQGPEHTYGGISTPDGHYTIEIHGDSGWIVSTDTISVYDPNEPHAPIPPELGGEEEGAHRHHHRH
ncbi:hypothetical protein CAI21_03970 [Alkalilimnicola ehrlichii]|uniref:Uncharacterized protein n=1 Tax=Alkalilimnicola ehrlichii TaxID=351052 RepID=A0A3E0X1V2_9GAMM|nr:hypothetical protein [Alkalilimnicola ehrlichii]RFA30682.1 hypothetical protein CAI21_03970 [Alkalilimnicola ehrlichii]RFA38261.1 hypothetical protein CAL65_05340 [Alkalilimnicola ehrlichii]